MPAKDGEYLFMSAPADAAISKTPCELQYASRYQSPVKEEPKPAVFPEIKNIPREMQIEQGVLVKYSGNDAHITIPEGVQKIGYSAFAKCDTIVSVVLPNTVEEIKLDAFTDCKHLTEIKLNEGLKIIGLRAFMGCTALRELRCPGTLEKIDRSAFRDC